MTITCPDAPDKKSVTKKLPGQVKIITEKRITKNIQDHMKVLFKGRTLSTDPKVRTTLYSIASL